MVIIYLLHINLASMKTIKSTPIAVRDDEAAFCKF